VDEPALGSGAICVAEGPQLDILVGCVVDMPVVSRELDGSASASPSSFDGNIVGNSDGFCDGESDGCSELYWVALVGTSVGCIDKPEDGARVGIGLRANCDTSIRGSVLGTTEGAVLGGVYKRRVGRKVGVPLGAAVGAKLGAREGPREGAKVG
jgi:hypothetical protein